jgi:cellobiose-specific phosphotransferase system component IIA
MKVKNILNTANAAASVYFEPLEEKDLDQETVDLILFAGKGFEIVVEAVEELEETELECKCGFRAKTKAGLKAHQRKCQ